MLIGVIADDFTGASDIAVTLARGLHGEGGLKTAQYLGVPTDPADPSIDAGVVALKSRSVAAELAVSQSLAACRWLQAQGCQQIVFKYCSTFDSTAQGNIGPVLDALARHLSAKSIVVCPSFPALGRTLYQGHLFVHDKLLNESGMQHHPVTPMKDADIRRLLSAQAMTPVRHIPWQVVRSGAAEIKSQLTRLAAEGAGLVVTDAITDHDLAEIGLACAGLPLLSGGSAIASGLPHNFIREGKAKPSDGALPAIHGPEAILVGSCSGATLGQIEKHRRQAAVLPVSVDQVMKGQVTADTLVEFILSHQGQAPLIYSSGTPEEVAASQQKYGQQATSAALENLFGDTARLLVDAGVRRLVVGGGETSGAVVSALSLGHLAVGKEIDPGVPVLQTTGAQPLALALKSGNFGSPDFFAKALAVLAGEGGE